MTKKKKTLKPGTYVSRSVYTKLQMENKRLLADLRTICCGDISPEKILLRVKWRDKFEKDDAFNSMLQDFAKKHFSKHKKHPK